MCHRSLGIGLLLHIALDKGAVDFASQRGVQLSPKCALGGSYHAFDFAKYAHRYLAGAE